MSRLGSEIAVNFWKDTVLYDELTINQQQKDPEFCSLLDEVCHGSVSQESIATLKDRVVNCLVVDKFRELECSSQSPMCLLPWRSPCEEFNNAMLDCLQSELVEIACTKCIDETKGAKKWNQRAAKELDKLNRDSNLTSGLEVVLHIAVGARLMLRRNVDTDRGLVICALGSVNRIQRHHVTVRFDNTNCELFGA